MANEQVIDGKGWRSGATVELKEIDQWFLKITDYADELLTSIENLDWPENVKSMQKNWIGKSFGSEISFPLPDGEELTAFTTRIDTIYGVTYLAISPNHPISQDLANQDSQIDDFIKKCNETKMAEADMAKADKLGLKTNLKVKHPFTGIDLDVWIANYVLMDYGTGVVMGVPAHDERDHEFALKYNIDIKQVIKADEVPSSEKGELINSEKFNGLTSENAIQDINSFLEKEEIGKGIENFRLRDWGVSRQRFWGCPIPVVYKNDEPVFLTWLPLSHSYEHTVQFVQISLGAKVFYAESLEKLISNMSIAKPTIMTAVPRFYQNLFNKINSNFNKQSGIKKGLINKTLDLGLSLIHI